MRLTKAEKQLFGGVWRRTTKLQYIEPG